MTKKAAPIKHILYSPSHCRIERVRKKKKALIYCRITIKLVTVTVNLFILFFFFIRSTSRDTATIRLLVASRKNNLSLSLLDRTWFNLYKSRGQREREREVGCKNLITAIFNGERPCASSNARERESRLAGFASVYMAVKRRVRERERGSREWRPSRELAKG